MHSRNKVEYHCSCIMINNLITKNKVAFACFVKVLLHYDCTQCRDVGHQDTYAAIPAPHCSTAGAARLSSCTAQPAAQTLRAEEVIVGNMGGGGS